MTETLKIKKQKEELTKDLEWNNKVTQEAPNVIEKNYEESKKLLINFEIIKNGTGNIVSYQSPKAGTKVEDRSRIRLFMK